MKIHYFQRYHTKENVATANTMLLLSRLYAYSTDKFFRFLKSQYFSDSFDPEIVFRLQESSADSVPDATITQESFKIVVETKMSDWFYDDQLLRHLKSFHDEKNKVLLTIAPEPMSKEKMAGFMEKLKEYNKTQNYPVIHVNTTFEELADAVREVLDDRDYELQDILEDYCSYCNMDGLIPINDSWKFMKMQLAGKTLKFNLSENVYYDNAERGFRAHDFLGLYHQKSVRAIGKISARITAVMDDGKLKYEAEFGTLTEERKATIERAVSNAELYGYNLKTVKHRYFFVEKFYETDFKKITPNAPWGSRVFDLTQVLEMNQIPETVTIADLLKTKTWS